jgi:hypothetical protein
LWPYPVRRKLHRSPRFRPASPPATSIRPRCSIGVTDGGGGIIPDGGGGGIIPDGGGGIATDRAGHTLSSGVMLKHLRRRYDNVDIDITLLERPATSLAVIMKGRPGHCDLPWHRVAVVRAGAVRRTLRWLETGEGQSEKSLCFNAPYLPSLSCKCLRTLGIETSPVRTKR